VVIENGVDLDRFRTEPERPGQHLLCIGSFRHFPNVAAHRFFTEHVWPLLRDKFRIATYRGLRSRLPALLAHFGSLPEPPVDERIRLLGFVADVRPLYVEANLVLVPTTVSAGTNIKALVAMAMRRAVESASSGCAGLGPTHGHNVWIADTPKALPPA
jgi:hypothetical protein